MSFSVLSNITFVRLTSSLARLRAFPLVTGGSPANDADITKSAITAKVLMEPEAGCCARLKKIKNIFLFEVGTFCVAFCSWEKA